MDNQSTSLSGQPLDISWTGRGSKFIGLGFKIFFLKIITLGIYHFWGKTELRRRLWGNIRLNSEPVEYTGTGMQLFLGFLLTMLVLFLPAMLYIIALTFMFQPESVMFFVGIGLLYVFFLYLIGVAMYSAQQYRLSRTQWRGIRGQLKGSKWRYGFTTFWTTLVSIITLGLAVPWQSIKLNRIMTNNTHFGETPMHFTGKARDIFKYYLIPWAGGIGGYGLMVFLLMPVFGRLKGLTESGAPVDPSKIFSIQLTVFAYIIIFGLLMSVIYAWYQSKYYNYTAAHTHFSNGSFNLNTTGKGLMWLVISNFLIIILSLTILTPVAVARMFGYIMNNLSFNGNVDLTAIQQSEQTLSKTGEGLAEGFDIGSF